MGVLTAIPVLDYANGGRLHVKLDALCLFGAAVIAWSILPRIDWFEAPGVLLARQEHPRLFAEIDRVAAATAQAPPVEVYLVRDVNAFVTERGGLGGIGRRRVMGLGLPLLHVLTVKQLRAVLAHEFGHFVGGDTALGPWIYRTRGAIGRTVDNLGATEHAAMQALSLPFAWYGALFLRITLAISRAQEYAADKLAARLEGPAAIASSLERIRGAALAMPGYLEDEYGPVLGAGFRAPFGAGFQSFLRAPSIAGQVDKAVEEARINDQSDPMDSHPCLRDRLAAVANLGEAGDPDDGTLAHDLLGDSAGAELALLRSMVARPVDELVPIAWSEVGHKVTLARMRASLANAGPMSGRFADLNVSPEVMARLGASVAPGAPPDQRVGVGAYVVTAAVLVRLSDLGFVLEAPPGEPFVARRGEVRFVPGPILLDIVSKKRPPEAWVEALRDAGLEDAAI